MAGASQPYGVTLWRCISKAEANHWACSVKHAALWPEGRLVFACVPHASMQAHGHACQPDYTML